MNVLFKNTTKYTKENCSNFIEFHTNKYGTKEIMKFILISICIIYILIFNLVYKNWSIVLGILVLTLVLYLYNNKKDKKSKREKVKEYVFYFYENHIKVKYKKQFQRISYFEFKKVFETEKYFFLYVTEKSSLILAKKGFNIGTPEEFAKFIKRKCPLKYSNESK